MKVYWQRTLLKSELIFVSAVAILLDDYFLVEISQSVCTLDMRQIHDERMRNWFGVSSLSDSSSTWTSSWV